jgi:hypothetical protein
MAATPPIAPTSRLLAFAGRRPLAFFAGVLALALALVGAERALARWRYAAHPPQLRGEWIWAQDVSREGEPIVFHAARDFFLDAAPQADDGGARLAIVADEAYLLVVNGVRVGSGSYQQSRADVYDLTAWLDAGWNRLVVELRSESGAGGLLAGLDVGGRSVLRTDASWRIVRAADTGLLNGWRRLDEVLAEPPQVWSRPPTGRWRVDLAKAAQPPRPGLWPEAAPSPAPLCPRRVRHPSANAPWVDLEMEPGCPAVESGDLAIWDFGEEVEGFLELGLDPLDAPAPALVFFGLEEPSGNLSERRPDLTLLRAPGAWSWADAHSRRFRYVALIGARPVQFFRVLPVDETQAIAYQAPPPMPGVFGLKPPQGATALEESIWQRAEGRVPTSPGNAHSKRNSR